MANVMAGLVEPDHVEAGAERTSWFSVTMPCSSFMGGSVPRRFGTGSGQIGSGYGAPSVAAGGGSSRELCHQWG